ncbi:MAG: polyketide synthase dehydratase domain-containing protein, partial [Myxococcota bacterium]
RPHPTAPADGDQAVPEPYGPGALFHGPAFRVLSDVSLGGADRGTATVRGVGAMGWPADGWVTDAAAFDGGLQLALLRGVAAGLGPTLPLRAGRVRWPSPLEGPARCGVVVRERTAERLVVDLTFTGLDGAALGSAEAVELYRVSPEASG